MRGLSIRELTTLANEGADDYERGQHARRASANTPTSPAAPWPPTGAYGEPISQLTTHDRLLRRDATPLAEQAEEESI
jgi:hypothetical protein